jgi:hypothetical protein
MNLYKALMDKLSLKKTQPYATSEVELPRVELRNPYPNVEDIDPPEIVSIDVDGFLDATDKESIQRYMNNLALLKDRALKDGKVDKFVIIRNDDNLPDDWEWRVASGDTVLEKYSCFMTPNLRLALAKRDLPKKNTLIDIPSPADLERDRDLLSRIDKDVGFIQMPIHYRSTKHFTVNTPLTHTGAYNNVDMERNFHVIDSMDNFLASRYGYSASYKDAYLDVSHESLPVSPNAVVMISEDKYKDIINNPKYSAQLQERKVIVFRGDEGLAINMFLTGLGIFPPYCGHNYVEMTNELYNVLDSSIQNLCAVNEMGYDISHASHFTARQDDTHPEFYHTMGEFISYLRARLPEVSDYISSSLSRYSSRNEEVVQKIIDTYGVDNLLVVLDDYNAIVKERHKDNLARYKSERNNMSPDTKDVFREVFKQIVYYNNNLGAFPEHNQIEVATLIKEFYHGRTIEEQLSAAGALKDIFSNRLNIDNSTTKLM